MDLRIERDSECWNKKALEAHANQQTNKEDANMQALPLSVYVDVGQIGCNGCLGDSCTASISRTVIRPAGQVGEAVGEQIEDVPGFERERPEGFGEADVIELRRDVA